MVEDIDRLSRALDGVAPEMVDISAVDRLDTAGAWLVTRLGGEVHGASASQHELLELVGRAQWAEEQGPAARPSVAAWLDRVGRRTAGGAAEVAEVVGFLGLTLARIGRLALRPGRIRLTPLVAHMQSIGVDAVPIVSLMAFLIGVVLAFQGAAQLRQFGAEVFVVDLIAISILRELGILLTAIIVAGRSGAAFTAAIGSMKMREEVDAMRTLGLDPVEVLVVPRVLALVLVLPILGLVANLMGLVGGAIMSWIELGVSPAMFRTRLGEGVDVWHYAVGLIKAPFFALIVGIVGCHQGFAVGGNAESLGRLTSRSVVISIFMVIVADALFSIFFALVGV
ncbi:MlaE family ABC transporter permease [Roseitranquillus sediminis]|uniref:MlaE family ABC transporter permease n=1 Tax=Roseitranquillus sediminis TaxID=2809051 RepID=UPI001D0C7BBB|nr:ABC transporter permease [Roseitranquillus sediminis]MBM9595381.1 ABC transporter permease [Roseitranquillus sediminis]